MPVSAGTAQGSGLSASRRSAGGADADRESAEPAAAAGGREEISEEERQDLYKAEGKLPQWEAWIHADQSRKEQLEAEEEQDSAKLSQVRIWQDARRRLEEAVTQRGACLERIEKFQAEASAAQQILQEAEGREEEMQAYSRQAEQVKGQLQARKKRLDWRIFSLKRKPRHAGYSIGRNRSLAVMERRRRSIAGRNRNVLPWKMAAELLAQAKSESGSLERAAGTRPAGRTRTERMCSARTGPACAAGEVSPLGGSVCESAGSL